MSYWSSSNHNKRASNSEIGDACGLKTLSEADREELAAARAIMPVWMAEPLSARLAHG